MSPKKAPKKKAPKKAPKKKAPKKAPKKKAPKKAPKKKAPKKAPKKKAVSKVERSSSTDSNSKLAIKNKKGNAHYLIKLIKTPKLEDPANNHMDIHRHFHRYSKGEFLGPAIKLTKTNAKLTLKGSHEYEDVIQSIVAKTITEEPIDINGVLITGGDIQNNILNLGLDWKLKKSTGKTKKYQADITDAISKQTLIESIDTFRKNSYLLISFNISPSLKVTTKKRIPQPSKKKAADDDVGKRISFCTGVIPNTEENLKFVLEEVFPEFISELPNKWRILILKNNYKIDEIILPKDIKNSMLLRIMAIRKGKMFRIIEIDGELIEKQYNIVV